MRAVILAGGKGTRLRPFTSLIPKPLVPVGGKYSIMEVIIMQLAKAGFDHVTIAVNHLAHLIMSYFGDGAKWGIKIDYSIEEQELSTIAPLKLIKDLPDTFLVMNGDVLSNLDFEVFYKSHKNSNSEVSVAAFPRNVKIDYGVLHVDKNDNLKEFQEKPSFNYLVSMGVYCINKKVIDRIDKEVPYGFDDLMTDSIENNQKVRIDRFNGIWYDIGRPEDYEYVDSNFDNLFQMIFEK